MLEKMTNLGGVSWATAYHDYFKGNLAEGRAKGEASHAEMAEIAAGLAPLPAHCRLIFDVDNMPHGSEVLHWPTWTLSLYDAGKLRDTVVLNNEAPESDIARIQGKDTPSSTWTRSSGYRLVMVFEGASYIAELRLRAEVGGITSDHEYVIPKASKA